MAKCVDNIGISVIPVAVKNCHNLPQISLKLSTVKKILTTRYPFLLSIYLFRTNGISILALSVNIDRVGPRNHQTVTH